jgi:hypothetical protein
MALLLQLEAASPVGLPLETLGQGLRLAGFQSAEDRLPKELDYLVGKHWVEKSSSLLNAGHWVYRLSATGRDALESEGLV